MPETLPNATDTDRALSAREDTDGFDTEVARFFGADTSNEEGLITEIETADFGRTARTRAVERKRNMPPSKLG